MGDDRYRFAYDAGAALRNAGKLLGMDLRECGANKLQGGYYINGEPHGYRRDKLKVFISRGSVWVSEEGGDCLSLPNWLMKYGGAADFKDALRMIRGESQALHWNGEVRKRVSGKVQYVSPDVLEAAKAWPLEKCPLFMWMCRMFPEEKVREAWEKYNVTTNSKGEAVFWYVDQNGRILYDKKIAYGEDGHRRKDYFPGRKYRVADGYTGKCYFGACLPDDGKKVFILESEKSCLLGYLYYGRRFIATGGKGNLREVEQNMLLLPDYDARDEWMNRGAEIWPWWEKWGIDEIPEHSDIGDMIEWKLLKK